MERVKKRMNYKIGIIGTGKIAGMKDKRGRQNHIQSHAAVCFNNKKLTLAAVCDTQKENLKKFLSRWRVRKSYSDVITMLDENVLDVISVCTPSSTHYEVIRKIIQHKNCAKILFVEKPLCVNKKEFIKIQELLKGKSVKMVCNHTYRFHEGIRRVKEIIRAKELGNVLEIRAVYYGGLLNNGIHLIDMVRFLLNSEIRVLSAFWVDHGRTGDLCANALLTAGHKPKVDVALESFDEKYYQVFDMEIRLTNGRIRIMDFARSIFIDKGEVNYLGEKELSIKKLSFPSLKSPMQNAYEVIVNYLKNSDASLLKEAALNEVEKTMRVLWAIKKKAE